MSSTEHRTHTGGRRTGRAGAADVVIIGGGIMGCAAAYRLAERGYDVLLLEKGDIASEQSGRNWGFVRQQGREAVEMPLARAANEMWVSLSDELDSDIEWRQGGNLALVQHPSEVARYQEWVRAARAVGLASDVLSLEQVREKLPGVVGEWALGVFTPSDGQADPLKSTAAFERAARRLGARIRTHSTVTRIDQAAGTVRGVHTADGFIQAQTVIVAAGIWSHRLLAGLRLHLPQRVVRQTVLRTNPQPQLTEAGVWAPDNLSFRQAVDGAFILSLGGISSVSLGLGSIRNAKLFVPVYLKNRSKFRLSLKDLTWTTARDLMSRRSYRLRPDSPRVSDVELALARMRSWFPGLTDLRTATSWTGLIDGTPDAVPVIERSPVVGGLVIASGFSGHGFALGPVVGEIVADLVEKGSTQYDLSRMTLGRFSAGGVGDSPRIL